MEPNELEKIINETFENKQKVSENSDKNLLAESFALFGLFKAISFFNSSNKLGSLYTPGSPDNISNIIFSLIVNFPLL